MMGKLPHLVNPSPNVEVTQFSDFEVDLGDMTFNILIREKRRF